MVQEEPHLVTLVKLVDEIPVLAKTEKRNRGRPKTYSKRLIVKAIIIMIVPRLHTAYSLLAFLDEETELTKMLKQNLRENGKFPNHRTW